jgi:Protein of unknown function (DUF1585)
MRASIPSDWCSKATAPSVRSVPRTSPDGRSTRRRFFPAVAGLEGVQAYIREHRQKDFLDNLSRKLLSYALGRSLQLSDEPAIERMEAKLTASAYRFTPLIDIIVTSPQFLNKRSPVLQERKGE